MKLGSPVKPSRAEAGVLLPEVVDATAAEASAVRADARLAERSFVALAGLAERGPAA
jgi:hypothetical protein